MPKQHTDNTIDRMPVTSEITPKVLFGAPEPGWP